VKKGTALDYGANLFALWASRRRISGSASCADLPVSIQLGWLPASGLCADYRELARQPCLPIMPAFVLGTPLPRS